MGGALESPGRLPAPCAPDTFWVEELLLKSVRASCSQRRPLTRSAFRASGRVAAGEGRLKSAVPGSEGTQKGLRAACRWVAAPGGMPATSAAPEVTGVVLAESAGTAFFEQRWLNE